MAGTKKGAKKAAATRKKNAAKKSPAKKSPAKKSAAKKSAAKKSKPGKHLVSTTFGGRKFSCAGKKVKVGKKKEKVARVFCRRAAK